MLIKHVFLYAIFAITGALGGCAAGSHSLVRRKDYRVMFISAYAVIGAAMGLAITVFMLWMSATDISSISDPEVHKLITISLLTGGLGSVVLNGMHAISKVILKAYGIEVTVNVSSTKDVELSLEDDDGNHSHSK